MSRARVARRIATAAAYGGGGLGLLGGAAVGLLLTEIQLAKRRIGEPEGAPPAADGTYGTEFAGRPPLRLAFLGDSTAAGLGVHQARQTPAALCASGLAVVAERPVELRNVALSGARSDDLERQVTMLLGAEPEARAEGVAPQARPDRAAAPDAGPEQAHAATAPAGRPAERRPPVPDLCVIMIGANDVTHRVPPARSVRHLAEAVERLRAAGCQVVVGTCPDLGTVEPVAQPLRWIARRLSRQLAAAQTIAVVERGGRTVSLGDLLGPEFAANPGELFGPDRYHPSAEGYATAAMAILPTLCAALGLWPEGERPERARREGVLPVARAAAEAAGESGTEVAAAGGARTPWALLKHRRRRRLPAVAPAAEGTAAPGAGTAASTGADADTPAATAPADAPDQAPTPGRAS